MSRRNRERRERAYSAAQVIEDDRLEAIRRAFETETPPPLNGAFEGPEFVELALTTFDPRDGSEQGFLDFIENCNLLGFTTKQVTKASWIRHDHMTLAAKAQEKSRLDKCGKSALETFGPFNPNPVHKERVKYETR